MTEEIRANRMCARGPSDLQSDTHGTPSEFGRVPRVIDGGRVLFPVGVRTREAVLPDSTRSPARAQNTLRGAYRPSVREAYMSERQLAYFEARLLALRAELEASVSNSPAPRECGDPVDHAAAAHAQEAFWNEQARQRATLERVSYALRRIADGSFGYCAKSGRPIGLARLEANPTAMYALDIQARMERVRRSGRHHSYWYIGDRTALRLAEPSDLVAAASHRARRSS